MTKTPSEKMQDYRSRLRASGLRPVQIWVPDVKAADFAKQARIQSLRVADEANETDALDFIESIETEDLAPTHEH